MSEHDLEKLLGGFAADTLTREERQKLFTAALQDQQLFNTLANEQALKELLANPAVRRRLLTSLEQKSASGAGGSLSWLDWFRRPAGLAFAGGLTAAALAIVLGIKIYQDSLKQAAQSVVTEEARPATAPAPILPATQPAPPHVTEPQARAKENPEAVVAPAKKNLLADKMAKREQPQPPAPQETRASENARDSLKQEQDQIHRQAEAPVAALSKTEQGATSSADQKLAASAAPSAMSAPAPAQAAVSARTLFYGGEEAQTDSRTMAQEKERASPPLAESSPQSNQPERKLNRHALTGKTMGPTARFKPLGLRYSFVVRGTDGQDREVDAATASKHASPMHLTIETNQTAYLQIWKSVGSATPQLLLPEKDTGQISLKIAAGQRQQISLPAESGPLTLTARLSLVPFGPITRQEAALFDRLSPGQLQEAVPQEQATYVVNQDQTPTAQI
ncbi:MAG: hypothetical protein K8R65_00660, partial [Nitrospirae bacterium]|nr:hypothetical protein [Nitrospirota bacterium]